MNTEDNLSLEKQDETCVVCGKDATNTRGFAKINHEGVMVNLCCSGWLATFQAKPGGYLARFKVDRALGTLKKANRGRQEPR